MKKLLFLLILISSPCYASVFQIITTTVAVDIDSGGTNGPWTGPSNGAVEDGIFSTVTVSNLVGHNPSEYLETNTYGPPIPNGAVIVGILAEIKKLDGGGTGTLTDSSVKIFSSTNSADSLDKADTVTPWPATLSWISYGSSTDTWGLGGLLTASYVNSPGFGVGITAKKGGGVSHFAIIDAMRITIYYIPTVIYKGTIYKATFE